MTTTPSGPPGVPSSLVDFLDTFARGEYWESHEVLEGPWRRTGSDFYQGLILYASAWVHWQRGNAHGVDAQLRKALDRLAGYPAIYLGVHVASIRTHCRETRDVVREDPEWRGRVSPLALELDPASIGGDEPEIGT